MTSIVLVGFVLALGSNAWADRDRGKKGHRNGKDHHYKCKNPPGHHYGWHKGKWNPHRDRYQHRKAYHHRDRHHRDRYDKGRHHRKRVVEKHVYHHRPKRHRHVEKHVYHHYPKRHRYDEDRSSIAFMVVDQVLGIAVAVNGTN
jgi:hypothetical protein